MTCSAWAGRFRVVAGVVPVFGLVFAGAVALFPGAGARAADDTPVEVQAVDALNQAFGVHPGLRANHAKGVVVEGSFTATPEAAGLSRAAHLQGRPVPVVVRFSDAGGLPGVPDGAPGNPHGMAVKFHLPDGSETDVLGVSLSKFPVSSVAEFRDLFLAVAATKPDSPQPTPIARFMASHPVAARALAVPPAVPASFASETYYGVNAFLLVGKDGHKQAIRYRLVPAAGDVHLDDATAARQAPDFLIDEIKTRLASAAGGAPVTMRLIAQLAEPGDPTADPAVNWPEDRKLVVLGEITLLHVAADSAAAEKPLLFLPGQLTDGIEASDDPMIDGRDGAYAESFSRRSH